MLMLLTSIAFGAERPPVHAHVFVDDSLSATESRAEVPDIIDVIAEALEPSDQLTVTPFAGDLGESFLVDLAESGAGARAAAKLTAPTDLYTFYSNIWSEVYTRGLGDAFVVVFTDGEGSDPVNRSRRHRDDNGITDQDWTRPKPPFLKRTPVIWVLDGEPVAAVHESAAIGEWDDRYTLVTWNAPADRGLDGAVSASLPKVPVSIEAEEATGMELSDVVALVPWRLFGLGAGLLLSLGMAIRLRPSAVRYLQSLRRRREERAFAAEIEATARAELRLMAVPLFEDIDPQEITLSEGTWTHVSSVPALDGAEWPGFPGQGVKLTLADGAIVLKAIHPTETFLVWSDAATHVVRPLGQAEVAVGDRVTTVDGQELVRFEAA